MFGYTCLESLNVVDAFSDISNNIEIVKDEWGLAYLPAWGFSAFDNLEFGEGYQIKMIEAVTDFQFCSTIVGTSSQEEPETEPQLQIGDQHAGGIVFYVDETGQHGLVAAIEDIEGTYEWGCKGEYIEGADGQAIGTGLQNTLDIVAQNCQTENGGITAAQAALDAEINDYNDWYLPSIYELNLMHNTIGQVAENIGGFENYFYWSSSEYSNYYAWSIYFGDGYSPYNNKKSAGRVRVIRAF